MGGEQPLTASHRALCMAFTLKWRTSHLNVLCVLMGEEQHAAAVLLTHSGSSTGSQLISLERRKQSGTVNICSHQEDVIFRGHYFSEDISVFHMCRMLVSKPSGKQTEIYPPGAAFSIVTVCRM